MLWATDWTATIELRIVETVFSGKRRLQQRYTRQVVLNKDNDYRIEEEWRDVPVVQE